MTAANPILLGVVGRPHGVRGLCHVHSYTADPADLARYSPLSDGKGGAWRLTWVSEGVARLSAADGQVIADRGEAEKLTNLRLYADRAALPVVEDEDEFYVADLIGMNAHHVGDDSPAGVILGVHDHGGGSYLEISQEGAVPLLLAFTKRCVPAVDLAARIVRVEVPEEIVVSPEHAAAEGAAA